MKQFSLLTLALAGQWVAPVALAADADNNNMETISVVGSRIALRTATDSVAPVDIITAEQLQATGLTDTARALQFAAPSYSFPFSAVTDGSDAVRPANLRGLSPDHTLVLVNGKRYHSSALVHLSGTVGKGASNVDLNTIPMAAIKRIEILRDGAAAQYGSDAIAGVINVVLKDNRDGGMITTQLGQTYQGDGEQWRLGANKGLSWSDNGFVNISLEVQHKNKTNRAGLDPRQQYPTLADGSPDPREETFDRKNFHVGDAQYDNVSLFANGAQYFGENKLYFSGGISERETHSGAFYRRALQDNNVPEIYPDGYLPILAPRIKDYSALLGYEFELGKWHVDTSASYGKNSFQYRVENSLNASYGPSSQTRFDAGTLATDEIDLTVDASRYFSFFNASDIMLAVGAAWRENSYKITAGETASYANGGYQNAPAGSQGFGGFTPGSEVDESRHNTAVYAELENQLSEAIYWSAALRYEDYSDFGDKVSWKLAGRYDFNDNIAIRATANTGFRAPSVQQLYFTNISTLFNPDPNTGELVPTDSGTFNNLSPVTQALQVGKLRPEESTSFSLGLVYTGDNGLTVTLDSYQIDIDDRIVLSSSLTPNDSAVIAAALAGTNAEAARFFINAVDTRTSGVDLVVTQQFDLGSFGDIKTSLTYAYNDTKIEGIHLPEILDGLQDKLFDHIEQVRMTDATSHHTGSLGFTHHLGDFTTNLRFSYFGPYTIAYSSTGDKEYKGKTTVDLSVAYAATENLTFTVGAQNLFDTYPEKRPANNNYNGIFQYPLTNSPFGFNGGYYFLEATYRF